MSSPRALESLADLTGKEVTAPDWIRVTRARVDGYCFALGIPAAPTIPPFLVLSLLPVMAALPTLPLERPVLTVNYGLEWFRPLRSVEVGDGLRVRLRVLEVSEIPGGAQLRRRITVENDRGDDVLEAETLSRLMF